MPAIPSREKSPVDDPQREETPSEKHTASEDGDHEVPVPLVRLEIHDLSTEGSKRFLKSIDPSTVIQDAIHTVHKILTPEFEGTPDVRSITLVVREFGGVAHTCGKDIDFEHKEIHFSTSYIESISPERLTHEITGVMVHEMVHVWQFNGAHSCNGGLIEGIADWVRLRAELGPPHWAKRCKDCNWDSGYDVTAYFLDWLEEKYGEGTVVRMNQKLRDRYDESKYWKDLFNEDVDTLWKQYAVHVSGKDNEDTGEDL